MSLPNPLLLRAQARTTPPTQTLTAFPLTLPTPPQSAEAVVRKAEQLQRVESYRQARQQFQQARLMPPDLRRSQELPAMVLRGIPVTK